MPHAAERFRTPPDSREVTPPILSVDTLPSIANLANAQTDTHCPTSGLPPPPCAVTPRNGIGRLGQ